MRKVFLKSIFSAFVFGLTLILMFIIVKARSGLQSSPGDKLTSATWNQLASKASVNYQKASFSSNYSTTTTAALVPGADLTLNMGNNPALVMTTVRVGNNAGGYNSIYCDVLIDGVRVSGSSNYLMTAYMNAGFTATLGSSYISNVLSAGSHNFKLYCWSDSSYYGVTPQSQFSVMELKQ